MKPNAAMDSDTWQAPLALARSRRCERWASQITTATSGTFAIHWIFLGVQNNMKIRTKLRLLGGAILLFNLWLIERHSIEGIPVLLMTFGFAVAYEYVVIRRAKE